MRISVASGAMLLVACTAFDDDLKRLLHDAGAAEAATPLPIDAGPPPCTGDRLRTYEGRCYRFNPSRVAWPAAESDCIAWGGHLVSIHGTAELAFVRDFVTDEEGDSGSTGIWIGLNARGGASSFTWSDGSPLDFQHWAEDEPDVADPPKECVYQYDEKFAGHWDNFQCSVGAESICVR